MVPPNRYSVAPPGLMRYSSATHDLRRGLYSSAATRLGAPSLRDSVHPGKFVLLTSSDGELCLNCFCRPSGAHTL